MTKEEIQKFVEFQLESMDYIKNFSEIDKNINYDVPFPSSYGSPEKFEMIRRCENKFNIVINIEDIKHDWDTELFVDFLYNKINKIIDMKKLIELAKGVQRMSNEELKDRIVYLEDRIRRQVFLDAPTINVLMEIQMVSQRIMGIAKKELKAENLYKKSKAENSYVPDSNNIKWNIIPKGDDQKYWLNDYGLRRWRHRVKKEFNAERPYYWCDRVIIMQNRTVIADTTFTKFNEEKFDFYNPELPEPQE